MSVVLLDSVLFEATVLNSLFWFLSELCWKVRLLHEVAPKHLLPVGGGDPPLVSLVWRKARERFQFTRPQLSWFKLTVYYGSVAPVFGTIYFRRLSGYVIHFFQKFQVWVDYIEF